MTGKVLGILAGVAVAALVAVRVTGARDKTAQSTKAAAAAVETLQVRTVRVGRADVEQRLSFTGNIKAANEVDVYAKVPGRIETLDAQIGDVVSKGQLLASVEHHELDWQLKQAEAAVAAARAGRRAAAAGVRAAEAAVAAAHLERDTARTAMDLDQGVPKESCARRFPAGAVFDLERDRCRKWHPGSEGAREAESTASVPGGGGDVAADSAADSAAATVKPAAQAPAAPERPETPLFKGAQIKTRVADSQVEQARSQVAAVEAQGAQAEAAVGLLKQQLENTRIVAPIDGTVVRRNVNLGVMAAPQLPVFTVMDLSTLKLESSVDAATYARLTRGMPISLDVEGFARGEVTGRIEVLSPMLDPQTRRAAVEISIDNADGRLMPNLFARAELVVGSYTQALVVPREAVLDAPGGAQVFRVVDGKVQAVRPQLGQSDGTHVVVIDGLVEGDELVVGGLAALSDGLAVRVSAESALPAPTPAAVPSTVPAADPVATPTAEPLAGIGTSTDTVVAAPIVPAERPVAAPKADPSAAPAADGSLADTLPARVRPAVSADVAGSTSVDVATTDAPAALPRPAAIPVAMPSDKLPTYDTPPLPTAMPATPTSVPAEPPAR